MSFEQRYLRSCLGSWLDFYCARCGKTKRFDADRTYDQTGDHNIKGMCVVLAEALGCTHAVTTSKSQQCLMRMETRPKPKNDPISVALRSTKLLRAGLRIMRDEQFDELEEWHLLYAACTCGRTVLLDKDRILAKHGSRKAHQLAHLLTCRRCGKDGRRDFAVTFKPR